MLTQFALKRGEAPPRQLAVSLRRWEEGVAPLCQFQLLLDLLLPYAGGGRIDPNMHNVDTNVGVGIDRYQCNDIDIFDMYQDTAFVYIDYDD